jgi:hypothetical protein
VENTDANERRPTKDVKDGEQVDAEAKPEEEVEKEPEQLTYEEFLEQQKANAVQTETDIREATNDDFAGKDVVPLEKNDEDEENFFDSANVKKGRKKKGGKKKKGKKKVIHLDEFATRRGRGGGRRGGRGRGRGRGGYGGRGRGGGKSHNPDLLDESAFPKLG